MAALTDRVGPVRGQIRVAGVEAWRYRHVMRATRQVWDDALALPVEEREALARALLDSVDGVSLDEEPALVAELERRAREVAAGTAELVEWPTVREALRARAGRAGQGR